ncbi:MAG: alcohol dehydrogenase catalytic domain-containing protein [Pyrobaculum sp.]
MSKRLMRAVVFKAPGQPLELAEVPVPTLKEGEVLVRVAATGVCHTDLHILDGEFLTPPEGFILGHEVSGWVEELGPGCELTRGTPVVVSWIVPCGKCRWCIRGRENYCPHAISKMPGLLGLDGGHAEFMAVPETAVFPIPPGVDVYTAAAVACAYGTAYRALKEANVGPGVSIVVVGAGGVGLAAVELANALGAYPIVAIDIRDAALARAKEMGATHVLDARDPGLTTKIREITQLGADVVYETKPNPDLSIALEVVRRGGVVVVTGLGLGGVQIPTAHLVMNGIKIIGSLGYRPRSDIPELLALAAAGKINPAKLISHRYRPEEINQAYSNLRRGLHSRALVIWTGEK